MYSHIINLFLQALYYVLGIVPSYQPLVGPLLNEICLGLKPDEIATVSLFAFS